MAIKAKLDAEKWTPWQGYWMEASWSR